MVDAKLPTPPSKHMVIASWLFGSLLLLFYMGVFAFAPAELPEFKHKQLAILSALLCALFTFFFVGSLQVTVKLKTKWSKLAIQSGGGAAAFVLILWWWNNPDFAPVKSLATARQSVTVTGLNNTTLTTQGPNSPAINSGGGTVNIQYGVPQKVVDRLEELLTEKEFKLQEREGVIANWIQKYKDLENQLASRTDEIAKQAKAFLDEGKLEEAEQLFKQVLEKELKNAAANAFSLAQIKVLQLEYPEAKAYYRQAVQLEPENALYLNDLGVHLVTLGEYAEAEAVYLRSLAIDEKALGKDHPDVATSLNNLAGLYDTQGNYDQAEPLYFRGLAIWEKALGKDHPNVATSLNNLAELYRAQGQYDQAEALYIRSLAIKEKALGKNHPAVATSLNNLATLYFTQAHYDQAEALYSRSLAILEKTLGKDHPDLAKSLNNLAALYQTQSKYDQAEPLYIRTLAIQEKALGQGHPDLAQSLNNLAFLYFTQGKYDQAEALYSRSLAIREKAFGKDHPDVGRSLNNLAGLYVTQGKYDQAEPLYLRGLAIRETALGKDHPDVATSLNNLAGLYDTEGRYDEAEPLYLRSLAILEKALGKDHPNNKTVKDNLQILQARLHSQVQVQVKAILPDSQAEQLGIQAGDIFTYYNNKPILGMTAFIHGRSLEPPTNPAQELKVLRDGKELVFQVNPGKIGAELQEQVLAKRP